jgi:hypothetical protein
LNFDLITEKPLWYSLFCILAGVVASLLLYYRDHRLGEIKPWLLKLMSFFRFFVITVTAFLLLNPLIRTLSRNIEKPIIVVAQDNSQSVVNGSGKDFLENEYKPSFNNLVEDLKKDYDVRTLSFGDAVNENPDFSFTDKLTNYSTLFDEISVKYANRNLAGVIMATDGIFNQGSSPLYSLNKIKAPVYVIALGDTTTRKDLVLTRVEHNKTAFLGNSFPLQVIADARQCAGAKTKLTIEKDSSVILSRNIDISGNRFHQVIPVFLEAKEKGIQHYKVTLALIDGEINNNNNSADVFIEVAESRLKVLMLFNTPNPDIAAIKNVLEGSQNYEVKAMAAKEFEGNLNEYNLVILHQFPSADNLPGLTEKLGNTDASLFYILGVQTAVSSFNKMDAGITINDNGGKINEAQARVDDNFSLFTISEGLSKEFTSYPPLVTPFGNYKSSAENYTLLFQQIGNVVTTQPLLVFSPGQKHKNAVLCGEGFWKWRLHEYSISNKHDITDEIILKTVQYLSVKEKKSPFRVVLKNNFAENEPLLFDAELYNESQELINNPDAKITIYNNRKVAYPFTFSKTEKAYTLNAGFFPVGNYTFKAVVKLGDKNYSDAGEFTVSALQLEQSETRADHQLLFALSDKSGGKMVYPRQLGELSKTLHDREDIKPVIYSQKTLRDLVNLKWVFFLLMLLLSAEWFLRKRSGAY